MLNPSWKPTDIKSVQDKWGHIKLPTSESISAAKAEKLMLDYLDIREDWQDQYVNATYYEDLCEFKYEAAYQIAFMKAGEAEKSSDRSKDIAAKNDPLVKGARMRLLEAKAATLETKLRLEGSTLAHHAVKAISKQASDEKWM